MPELIQHEYPQSSLQKDIQTLIYQVKQKLQKKINQVEQYYILSKLVINKTYFNSNRMSQKRQSLLSQNTIRDTLAVQQVPSPNQQHDAEDNAFQLTPLERLIDKVGGEGKYQFRSFLIMASTWFLTAWLLLGIAFFFDDSITCSLDNQKGCMNLVCNSPQQQWKSIITDHANSIVFEFQPYLLCDSTSTILQSMVFIGSLVGFFIIPFIADNLGRKIAMQISWWICTLGVFLLFIANSITLIAIGYLLAGLGSNPAITLCFSFINEQCLYKSRQRYGVFVQIFLALGQSTIALMFIPKEHWGWRWVMGVLLIMVLIVNGLLFYLLETPKFLFTKSKQQTLTVLNQIATINKKQLLNIQDLNKIQQHLRQQDNNASLIDLFKYKSLRMITIATGFGFLGIQTIYYFTSLNLNNAGFNMLVNQQIIGGSEIAGYIVAEIIISKIKRKPFSLLGMGISSLVCLVLALLTQIGNSTGFLILETVGLIINRLVVCCFWSIFFVYVAELYPTKVRSLGYGWVSAIGMIGSALCPFLIQLSQNIGINTWIDPGVIGLVGTAFLIFLPQTYGHKLEDQIEEQKSKLNKYDSLTTLETK